MKQTLINFVFLASGALAMLLVFVAAVLDNFIIGLCGLPLGLLCAWLESSATVGKEDA